MKNSKEILKIASAFELISLGKNTKEWKPTNQKLWNRLKSKIKSKPGVWPSAYKSMQLSKEYKEKGGKWKKIDKKDVNDVFENENGELEARGSSKDLDGDGARTVRDWKKEKWVDVSRKNKKGKHPPCGRSDASKGGYPKCRPAGEAKKMTKKEKESATSQKRQSERNKKRKGKKPIRDNHKKKD